MVLGIDGRVPDPDKEKDPNKRGAIERALTYMNLEPGKPLADGSPGPSTYCAVIMKRVDEKTRSKTSINELLRS